MASVWSGKTACLVTGASQHIGAKMASLFGEKLTPGSVLILTSRSVDRLKGVKETIDKTGRHVRVELVEWDFRHPDREKFQKDLNRILPEDMTTFDASLIVHNAAQLGEMSKKVAELNDPKELQEQFNINVASMLVLNSVWLSKVQSVKSKFVVNMTAPSATNARPCFGMTSMVKSSRQITLSILSKENPDVKVLHFDPGAVDTDSLRACRDDSHDPQIRDWIKGFYDQGEVLDGAKVVMGLMKTLKENKFESGSVVSAYDVQ